MLSAAEEFSRQIPALDFYDPYKAKQIIIKRRRKNLMARGWESKQVEAQIESAREPQHGSPLERAPDAQQRQREREKLLLSRAYIRHQIQASANTRYTEALNSALEEIDRKLAALPDAVKEPSSG